MPTPDADPTYPSAPGYQGGGARRAPARKTVAYPRKSTGRSYFSVPKSTKIPASLMRQAFAQAGGDPDRARALLSTFMSSRR